MKLAEYEKLDSERRETAKQDSMLRDAAMLQAFQKAVNRMVERGDELAIMLTNAAVVNIIAEGMIALGLIVEQPDEHVTIQ